MFLDGLWRGDSGCHGSSLAGEVSRPLVFLITAWPAWADTFLQCAFPFCFHTFNILCLWSKWTLKVSLFMQKTALSPTGCTRMFIVLLLFSLLWYFSKSFDGCVFVIYRHLSMQTPAHAVTVSDSQRRLCGCLWGPLFSLGLGAPFSLLYPALHCTVVFCLSEHRDSFFVIVPADECLAILSSGGFATGWTNDLSSFVLSLKRTGDSAYCKEEQFT